MTLNRLTSILQARAPVLPAFAFAGQARAATTLLDVTDV